MTDTDRAFCTSCGALLHPDSTFCQECGSPVSGPDKIYSEGPGYVPRTFDRHQQTYIMMKAENRLRLIRFLMIGYLIIGSLVAIAGIFYESFLESIPLNDPDYEKLLGPNYYDDMLALTGYMNQLGMIFALSVLMILGSLILNFMKRHHTISLALCAFGSLVLLFTLSLDSALFTIIGLGVAYLLYTAKAAFID